MLKAALIIYAKTHLATNIHQKIPGLKTIEESDKMVYCWINYGKSNTKQILHRSIARIIFASAIRAWHLVTE